MTEAPRCPGQDMRYWKPEDIYDIQCPHCETMLEFFKDEPFLLCHNCQKEVRNPRIDMGCAKWCKFAVECIGEMPEDPSNVSSLCDRVIVEMKEVFREDTHRIDHALQVLEFAESLIAIEPGDHLTVKATAVLHDIGIHEAERVHGSPGGKYQEIEGPPIARSILEKLGLGSEVIDHICKIIGSHHSAKDIDTPEFRIIWDADWLVNFPDVFPDLKGEKAVQKIDDLFKTEKGKSLAKIRYSA